MRLVKGPPSVRPSSVLVVVLVVLLCAQRARHWQLSRRHAMVLMDVEYTSNDDGGTSPEEEYLERLVDRHGLTNLTQWQAWRVQASEQGESESGPVTDVGVNFDLARMQRVISMKEPSRANLRASKRLRLPTRSGGWPEQADASEFLFGISTSYERIAARDWAVLRAWVRWMTRGSRTGNGAGLVLLLDRATEVQLHAVEDALRDAGVDGYTVTTDGPMSVARRYHELVRVLKAYSAILAASGQSKRWYGIVEDSVFFPSLAYLRERLAGFKAQDKLCIGLLDERLGWREGDGDEEDDDEEDSDDKDDNDNDNDESGSGRTTSEGKALMLTREAVASISRLPCLAWDVSDEEPTRPRRWDELLMRCLKTGEGVDAHFMPALHPSRDALARPRAAAHETGARPLVLLDYQGRYGLDVGAAHLVTDVCSEACFMQRYLFHDNWLLVNGVSISQHPGGLEYGQRDMGRGGQRHHHRHHRRKMADGDEGDDDDPGRRRNSGQTVVVGDEERAGRAAASPTGRPNVWTLVDSAQAPDGAVWQAYLKRAARAAAEGEQEMDSVIVMIWENSTR